MSTFIQWSMLLSNKWEQTPGTCNKKNEPQKCFSKGRNSDTNCCMLYNPSDIVETRMNDNVKNRLIHRGYEERTEHDGHKEPVILQVDCSSGHKMIIFYYF